MAVLTVTDAKGAGDKAGTKNIATSSDTFTWIKAKFQKLIIRNITAGALTPNVVGSAPSSAHQCAGAGEKDLSGGYTFETAIPLTDGVSVLELNTIEHYLAGDGTVTITGADGAEIIILEY